MDFYEMVKRWLQRLLRERFPNVDTYDKTVVL